MQICDRWNFICFGRQQNACFSHGVVLPGPVIYGTFGEIMTINPQKQWSEIMKIMQMSCKVHKGRMARTKYNVCSKALPSKVMTRQDISPGAVKVTNTYGTP